MPITPVPEVCRLIVSGHKALLQIDLGLTQQQEVATGRSLLQKTRSELRYYNRTA